MSPTIARPLIQIAPALLLLTNPVSSVAAQVSVTVQGGVHAARLDRPERAVRDPAQQVALEAGKGEATTFGLRIGGWLSRRWGIDGGFALSRNRSWNGGAPMGFPVWEFQTQLLFSSATLRLRLTAPDSRLGLVVGAGPALIVHRGSGTSLLTRNTDLGGLVDVGGSLRVSSRVAATMNVHQYLFSSRFGEAYSGQFLGDPIQPAGSRFRHELVILAGLAWRWN